ncbi:hypothetical protein LUZ60_016219 [Juncus effusus]|nr:hypothetical protein LUZ60_016219 [Juncus effusus]
MIRSVKSLLLTKSTCFMPKSPVFFASIAPLRSPIEEDSIPISQIETRVPISILRHKSSSLSLHVSHTIKTFNWDLVKDISFANSVKLYGFSHSIESFAILIGIFSSSKMNLPARCLMKCLIDYNLETHSQFTFFNLPSLLVNLSCGALTLLRAYGALIQALVESDLLQASFQAYQEATKIGIQIGTPLCNFLLYNSIKRHEFDLAKILFQEMKQFGPAPNLHTYTIFLSLYNKSNNFDINEANFILKELEKNGLKPNVVTHGTYIHLLCGAGSSELAWEFLKELKNKKLDFNTQCFNSIILGFCQEGNLIMARTVFDAMKDFDLIPNLHSFNAFNLFNKMELTGLKPDKALYTTLISLYCKIGEMRIAVQLFDRMVELGFEPDIRVYSCLIDGYSKLGFMDRVDVLMKKMVELGFKPNVVTYTCVINGYRKMGDWNKAYEVYNCMINKGIKMDYFACKIFGRKEVSNDHNNEDCEFEENED